ncbi:hypothetical protein MAPG_11272 [Magnaporthiopsis poae ATCC 64411]|uniref:Uncharacterized protein n=1 Tax=Magnaporthiopsis poae (strain ATCC 64411 / 73-15) TaxID=644358 RepID=A0A0C4EEU1_MAGP6|nr:hypothetical protein MAPG_11272 [Magnaporthiopsis poae ATCC 64411]
MCQAVKSWTMSSVRKMKADSEVPSRSQRLVGVGETEGRRCTEPGLGDGRQHGSSCQRGVEGLCDRLEGFVTRPGAVRNEGFADAKGDGGDGQAEEVVGWRCLGGARSGKTVDFRALLVGKTQHNPTVKQAQQRAHKRQEGTTGRITSNNNTTHGLIIKEDERDEGETRNVTGNDDRTEKTHTA